MLYKTKNWLLKPYPFLTDYKLKIIISFTIGFFVSLFLFLFRPFEFNTLTNRERLYYQIIYGIITTSVILTNYFILPLIFPSFYKKDKWVIYKEVLSNFEIFFLIALLNWLISKFSSFYHDDSYFTLSFFIIATFSIGIIPLTFYILLEEQIFFKKNKEKTYNHKLFLHIKGDSKKGNVTIPVENFLYIQSNKNYSNIYYVEKEKITSKTIRVSLNKLEKQLKNYSFIFRCHKSYIVNKNQVAKITGNARGYKFEIKNDPKIQIPVSRKFSRKELLLMLETA